MGLQQLGVFAFFLPKTENCKPKTVFFKLSIPACLRHHGPGLPPEAPAGVRGPFPVMGHHAHGQAVLLVQGSHLTSGVRYWPEISPERRAGSKWPGSGRLAIPSGDDGPEKKNLVALRGRQTWRQKLQ